ncbi:MAG: cyclic nucleotide-binding domain-containing protein [Deltaproteobacteria bacterium]|nr:cyclic nucleotide-binding domain-containing protein [Deltaproteobacteria bacterium]
MLEADIGLRDRDGLSKALCAAFGDIDDATLAEIASRSERVGVPGGSILFRQGDPGDSVYILLRGRLQVVITDPESGLERILGEIAPGEAVGEIGLLTGEPRTATLWATRDSRLARIGQTAFDELAERNPSLYRQLAKIVVERLRERTSMNRFSPEVSNIVLLPARSGSGAPTLAEDLHTRLSSFGATLHLKSENVDRLAGLPGAALAEAGSVDDLDLGSWLAEQEFHKRFILYEADPTDTEWTKRCLRQADVVLIVADASDDPVPVGAELELLENEKAKSSVRRILALIQPPDIEKIRGTAEWLRLRSVHEHHHIRQGVPADLARLARVLSGNAVGLVLGGGGARGFAHIGAFRALFEQGVPIDWIGGSSIGSVFAAGIAKGWEPSKVEDMARTAFVNEKLLGDYTIPFVSLLRGKRLDRLAREIFEGDIEDLLIPYFCVSSNLSDGHLVVHESGSLWRSIRASVALPGVLPPAVRENDLMIDGGILNNLPVDVMRARSVGKVLVVDLSVEKEYTLDYTDIPSPFEILLSKLPFTRNIRVPGIVTLMMKSTVIASRIHTENVRKAADLVFNPPVGHFGLLEIGAFDEIVAAGYQHVRERIEELKLLGLTST